MSKFPVLDLWVKDWIQDTKHLRPLERGIYMDMLLLAWMSANCRLPNDPKKIAERLSYKPNEMAALNRVIAEFWTVDKRWKTLSQKRLTKEWRAALFRTSTSTAAANARWHKGKTVVRNAITATATDKPLNPLLGTAASARNQKRAERPPSKPKEAKPPRPVSAPSMSMAAAVPKPINAAELSADELARREREAIAFIESMRDGGEKDRE